MKRYFPQLLLLLLFASAEESTPPPPPMEACFCEEWLHFSDGSVDVCASPNGWDFDVRE